MSFRTLSIIDIIFSSSDTATPGHKNNYIREILAPNYQFLARDRESKPSEFQFHQSDHPCRDRSLKSSGT